MVYGKNEYMKSEVTFVMVAAFLLTGCMSRPSALVLDPVGPAPASPEFASANGKLIVYSAFDAHAHFNDLPYRRYYSDYGIYSEEGKLLRTVHNRSNTPLELPREVELPAGDYRIVARANGYGMATVPVRIAAHRITSVHLEGGRVAHLEPDNSVKLPDGRIVGWKANAEAVTQ